MSEQQSQLQKHIDCPHCKGGIDLNLKPQGNKEVELELPPVNKIEPKPEPEVKEVEKIVEKTKPPADQPFYKCKNCGDKHKNPNYSKKPNKQCPNCGSLNGEKNCKNCNKATDADDWTELTDEELEELEIPFPEENHNNHDHEHEA